MSNLKPYDMKEPVPSKDDYRKSKWFKQNAFEKGEMKMGPIIGFLIGVVLFVVIAFKFGVLSFLIKNTPTPMESIWGHGPKCINISFWLFILCLLGASGVKMAFYQIVGLVYGIVPTTSLDDFWLYDYPINPINVPACIIFNKPKDRTPQ
tara:strand:- start:109 stop:558 length:450 start_codon:yes stop_codon:yes gene_type:complete